MANRSFIHNANGSKPNASQRTPQSNITLNVTTASFKVDVLERSKTTPVLVDFWAPWCEPCKQLEPLLEKAVASAKGAVVLAKMNIDEHPAIAGQLRIQSIPAVIAFVGGQPVDGLMGAQPESEINKLIAKITGSEAEAAIEDALNNADQSFQSGDLLQASEIYSHILTLKPDNVAALAGMANCFLASGDLEKAELIISQAEPKIQNDQALRSIIAKIDVMKQTRELGDPIELKKRVEDNQEDFQARFDLALIHNAQGEKEKAANALLAIIKDDRNWGDDKARKQLLQLFDSWGPADAATVTARRTLAQLLFS